MAQFLCTEQSVGFLLGTEEAQSMLRLRIVTLAQRMGLENHGLLAGKCSADAGVGSWPAALLDLIALLWPVLCHVSANQE